MDKKMDKIIELFIKEPEREFHVREVANITKISPTSASKYLKEYKKEGYLTSKTKLNHLFFKADTENINFRNIKLYYNLSKLTASGLIDFLAEELNPETVVLFGSFAKAENSISSDIDLFVISNSKKELNPEKYEHKLKTKIHLFIHSVKELEAMKTNNKHLLNNVINGLILYGFFEVFR
ncbi:MAG: nucleotidyltransferase domain-containing protein [Candidatus Nanoarchaeia archaeon]|nr:nucleotidyltransferase domain-containing protein [Candidatus Nanoarchaeia archaeon]